METPAKKSSVGKTIVNAVVIFGVIVAAGTAVCYINQKWIAKA